ncbi:uncharacterized protein LOC134204219 [Armigeres subalbatus]|uniref:uncharacterized protein LOC134204219 n=1 Tax=Armigeres subalbatus TaxID=124917 RepID=UPI002ED5A51B
MDEERKQQLINRRTALMTSLGRAEQFASKYQANRDQAQLPLRIENLDSMWMGLEEVQTQLEECETTDEGREQNNQTRAKFESIFFKVKAALRSLLPANNTQNPSAIPNPAANALAGIKLPTISLPEFDGDYNQWLAFHDTFVALIHSNVDVPEVQKFHYLRAALKGEAAQLIESIAISTANYIVAWQALTSRYANDYLLKKRHLQALLDCPRMMRESAEALHSLVDEFQRHTKILRQLGEPVDQWSTMLEHLLCIRLDDGTLKAWEDFATTVDEPNYARLVDFLQRRIRVLESMSVNHQSHNSPMPVSHFPSNRRPFFPRVASHTLAEEQQPKCYACSQYHFLVKCPRFERMNVADRMKLIDTNRLCANCFRHDHFARNCQSKYSCRHCQRRHHTMLHNVNSFNESSFQPPAQRPANQATHQARPSSSQNNTPFTTTTYTCANSSSQSSNPSPLSNSNVLLSTVVLLVVDSNGSTHPARALLDSGSQSNIMSERLCQLLKLKRRAVNIPVHGVGESASNVRHSVHSVIKSRKNDFAMDLDFLVLPRVTIDLPAVTFSAQNWRIPQDLFLADPSFNKSGAIDLLLGAEHFYSFVNPGTRIEQDQQHLLVESVFGWIVVGRNLISPVVEPVACHVSVSDPLHDAIERFWKMEEINNKPNYSVEEQQCETHFVENVTRNSEGRYMVRLPRHPDFDHMLGETKAVAMRQYHSLEKRLERDPNLKQEYQNFLDEYLSLGHLRIVSANEPEPPQVSYIPHHPVVKESSTTTKVRVVFNGSVHSTTGFSLNDTLKVGPVVQDELLTLIIRFRKYPVALVADIEKMYRQVLVDPRDTPLQRIFWRFQPDGPIETCELLTVTYGLASSSFLATRTLNQLCQDEGDNFPLGGPALIKNFYVDDYIGGAQSIGEAINTRTELNELLVKGGFQLRKWASNVPRALEGLDPSQIESKAFLNLDTEKAIKTLGVRWEPKPDKLSFEIASINPTSATTKRTILAGVSTHFDPLGITSPVVIRAKILLQELWLQPCGWDDEISDPANEKWTSYCSDLAKLSSYAVDRYVFLPNSTYELHTFADASEQAYGACTFARSISSKGQIRVHLIAAKSRVAPLKRLSIPRLELSAAVLAARLHAKILEALDMAISASYFGPIHQLPSSGYVLLRIFGKPSSPTEYLRSKPPPTDRSGTTSQEPIIQLT